MSAPTPTTEGEGNPFGRGAVTLMLVIGILGFVGMLVLGAFAPDLRSGRSGGTHALSDAAVGYGGLFQLAAATGRDPGLLRNVHALGREGLLVVTPPRGEVDLGGIMRARIGKPTLLVMPKWETTADEDHSGWVRFVGVLDRDDPEALLFPATKLHVRRLRSDGSPLRIAASLGSDVRFTAPHPLQTIVGMEAGTEKGRTTLRPLITDRAGRIVLGVFADAPLYVLAEPDLLDNLGMRDAHQAASALALLDRLDGGAPLVFDLTANGFGHSASPLKLAFTPPFLAMTLAIGVVLLLLGLHALGRFGPVTRRQRAIPFGKAALVENGAALVSKAGREARLGGRYVQVVRARAALAFGAPSRLKGVALDGYLDRLDRGGRFTDLARRVEDAGDAATLVAAARALHDWQRGLTG